MHELCGIHDAARAFDGNQRNVRAK